MYMNTIQVISNFVRKSVILNLRYDENNYPIVLDAQHMFSTRYKPSGLKVLTNICQRKTLKKVIGHCFLYPIIFFVSSCKID